MFLNIVYKCEKHAVKCVDTSGVMTLINMSVMARVTTENILHFGGGIF